jgi:hypothetical protein
MGPTGCRRPATRAAGRVAIALLASSFLLAGCGDEENGPATTAATTEATETTTQGATTTQDATTADGDQAEGGGGAGTETIEIGRPVTIENTLEAVLTGSTDAALICDVLATEEYVRTAYGAREGCIAAQRPGALADSVRIEGVIRSGPAPGVAATALVVPAGGPYDGVEVEVGLVRDGDGWRVDSLLADVPAGP